VFEMEDSRLILLADMNAFFASCHQSIDPALRGKPVIVSASTSSTRRGIVIAASYEAKAKGVKTTMSYAEVRKICPGAIYVQRDHGLYHAISIKIMNFLRLIGDTETASIDEAYVDITPRFRQGQAPAAIAHYIQQTLWNKIKIPSSIGVGPNRIIAKMAAEVKKPRGYVQMGIRQFQAYFYPMPVEELVGCGKATANKLRKQGIITIGDLAKTDDHYLRLAFGKRGQLLKWAAQGMSSAEVNPDREKGDKSIGSETTFPQEVGDPEQIFAVAREMVQELVSILQAKEKRARTIQLVYKFHWNEPSHTKSMTLSQAADEVEPIYQITRKLYEDHLWQTPLYLFGVRLSNFEDNHVDQLSFDDFL
jgi:DNA polymerase IV